MRLVRRHHTMAKSKSKQNTRKLAETFCSCIKKVRKTVNVRGRNRSRRAKETAAIGICVGSVLKTRGRTLKRFTCRKKPTLITQTPK